MSDDLDARFHAALAAIEKVRPLIVPYADARPAFLAMEQALRLSIEALEAAMKEARNAR